MGTISLRFGISSLASLPRTLFGTSFRSTGQAYDGTVETLVRRAVQRRQLSELDDRQLQDIGISRAEAYRESQKPFWRK